MSIGYVRRGASFTAHGPLRTVKGYTAMLPCLPLPCASWSGPKFPARTGETYLGTMDPLIYVCIFVTFTYVRLQAVAAQWPIDIRHDRFVAHRVKQRPETGWTVSIPRTKAPARFWIFSFCAPAQQLLGFILQTRLRIIYWALVRFLGHLLLPSSTP
ncbi:hypothetical protein BKA82DRAFT_4085893 [Pisolithus tinctorius]|nr:hypothetical protein BKA82DRAFT_4085893 [Pisolithus tinctorius]